MQWWSQLSTAIVFGLGFATILTLVMTPSALMIKVNVHDWRARRRTAVKKEREKNSGRLEPIHDVFANDGLQAFVRGKP